MLACINLSQRHLRVSMGSARKAFYPRDMGIRFLKFLAQNEYLRAGTEGAALVQQYSFW